MMLLSAAMAVASLLSVTSAVAIPSNCNTSTTSSQTNPLTTARSCNLQRPTRRQLHRHRRQIQQLHHPRSVPVEPPVRPTSAFYPKANVPTSSDINLSCSNLPAGQPVCINVQPYTYTPIQAGAIWSKSQEPVPQLPNVVSSCKFFVYTTLGGSPGLSKILSDNGITREDWIAWNGQSNVWGGYFSCVSA
jgi:hypothetical protein